MSHAREPELGSSDLSNNPLLRETAALVSTISALLPSVTANRASITTMLARARLILHSFGTYADKELPDSIVSTVLGPLNRILGSLETLTQTTFMHSVLNWKPALSKLAKLQDQLHSLAQSASLIAAVDSSSWKLLDRRDAQLDKQMLESTLGTLIENDYKILDALELKHAQYLEAIEAIEKALTSETQLEPNAAVPQFLDTTLNLLRRATTHLPHQTQTTRYLTNQDPTHLKSWVLTTWEFEQTTILHDTPTHQLVLATWLGHKTVTLKKWKLVRLETTKLVQEFEREVEKWFPLRHPHVLPLLGACATAEWPFMEKGSLLKYLRLQIQDLEFCGLKALQQVSMGMQYLHSRGVLHGDLRAEHILIDEYGRASISEFGFTHIKQYSLSKQSSLLDVSSQNSLLRWMSPERLSGGKLTISVDVYAFACLCYEVLTMGDIPFANIPDAELFNKVVTENQRPAYPNETVFTTTGVAVFQEMEKCWGPDPQLRPSFSVISAALSFILNPLSNASSELDSQESLEDISHSINALTVQSTAGEDHPLTAMPTDLVSHADPSIEHTDIETIETPLPLYQSHTIQDSPLILIPLTNDTERFHFAFHSIEITATGFIRPDFIIEPSSQEGTFFDIESTQNTAYSISLAHTRQDNTLLVSVSPKPPKPKSKFFSAWAHSLKPPQITSNCSIRILVSFPIHSFILTGTRANLDFRHLQVDTVFVRLHTGTVSVAIPNGYKHLDIELASGKINAQTNGNGYCDLLVKRGSIEARGTAFIGTVFLKTGIGRMEVDGVNRDSECESGTWSGVTGVGLSGGVEGSFKAVVGVGSLHAAFDGNIF
ncbi:hypothetical protein CcCBS67573_g00622 [Chytriomyces confervae]|uniref:Protein kinase domain-containing protein n=1 Tax=Chytriomyces confervae TaxID=246404 RepID=A0A507FP81_9FUNG|nr:hypothetical protein CcCBS67573_g00622 [Chytriomyces confervae]